MVRINMEKVTVAHNVFGSHTQCVNIITLDNKNTKWTKSRSVPGEEDYEMFC